VKEIGLYPDAASTRDRFVLERRGPRPAHNPWQYQGLIVEDERTASGGRARTATVLLTGRECPWRCAMCDLWAFTTESDTPADAIPAQIRAAQASLEADGETIAAMKLYNAGSFFDPRAVPEGDYDAVADALDGVSRVVVESHPALVGPRVDRFLESLARHSGGAPGPASLEVAMGLETAHPSALDRLNKRFTLEEFASAARGLAERGVALRVFLLISPPFVPADEQDAWLCRSVDAALTCGASVVSLVPTRSGNGTVEALADENAFRSPTLVDIERSAALAQTHAEGRGRIFVDIWDLERFAPCAACLGVRRARLQAINLEQSMQPTYECAACGDVTPS
jgi:radical SAM enzyme (TIGR01210 family)